jgi:NAD+ kinase
MNVGIIVNRDKDQNLAISRRICSLFDAQGASCIICEQEKPVEEKHFTDPGKLSKDLDFVITVGGDGTLIQAARDLHSLDIPIIGVNMGTLGFLAELDIESIPGAVKRLCAGDYFVEEHMMILGSIYRDGVCISKELSLNDAVLSKYGHTHVIHFDVYVDDQLLNDYTADGLIISTPTGSTAYNLSAGGPLIVPNASMMVMTPICAHALNARSVVLPDSSRVKICIKDKLGAPPVRCVINFDGAELLELRAGDVVELERAPVTTRLLRLDHTSFFKVLQKKMSSNF